MSNGLPKVTVGEFAIRGIDVQVMHGIHAVRIVSRFRVANLANPAEDTTIFAEAQISNHIPPREFDRAFRWELKRSILSGLEHELDEWLRVDGELLTDPHPEGG